MDATVAIDKQRIFYIIAVERDSAVADRRRKRVLEDAYLVVIDIDIGKNILRYRIQDITCLEEVVNAG